MLAQDDEWLKTKLQLYGLFVEGIIGKGSYGTVFKCSSNGRHYAVKAESFLKARHNSQRLYQHLDECNICMRLLDAARQGAAIGVNSENVVQVHNVFYDQENYYIVMEYLNGQTLFDLIKNNYRNGLCDAGPKAVQMCAWSILSGIRYLKRLNIVHRDIKPTNVFISERGPGDTVVKLIDLGLGIILDDYSTSLMSSLVGTRHYAIPAIEDGTPYTSKCDLWCAGMTIYFMATGRELVPDDDALCKQEKKVIWDTCGAPGYRFRYITDLGLNRILQKLLSSTATNVEEIMADPWFDGCTVPRNPPQPQSTAPTVTHTRPTAAAAATTTTRRATRGFGHRHPGYAPQLSNF